MKSYLLSFLISILLSFPSMARDTPEISVFVGGGVEDPNYLDKFHHTYPQNCPECSGQIIGMTMSPFKIICGHPNHPDRHQSFILAMPCCFAGGLIHAIGCCEPIVPLCMIPCMVYCSAIGGERLYGYAEMSGRRELTERADFARLCLPEDPLSCPACYGRVIDYCCVPIGNGCSKGASVMKDSCVTGSHVLKECLTPVVTAVSKTIWDCCLGSCIRMFCGSGTAENKQEV